jgi:hypothetical protein
MTNNEAVGSIPQSWILLDSQSTCNVLKNRNLLINVRQAPYPVIINSQADTHWGNFGTIKNVWLYENSIANILNKSSHIVYDSENGYTFMAYVPSEPHQWTFIESGEFVLL